MTTQADKQTRLEALRKLRDTGAASMSHDGVQTSFRSVDEINQTILQLERDLGVKPKRRRFASVYMGHR